MDGDRKSEEGRQGELEEKARSLVWDPAVEREPVEGFKEGHYVVLELRER